MELLSELSTELSNLDIKWYICGGHAIDLYLGETTRQHKDLDITVRIEDLDGIVTYLQSRGWLVYAPVGGGRFAEYSYAKSEKNLYFDNIWCFKENPDFIEEVSVEGLFRYFSFHRIEQSSLDFIEILCSETSSDNLVYLKNRAIQLPLDKAFIAVDSYRILAPEMILLYKMRSETNEAYQQDFKLTIDNLNSEQYDWLMKAIRLEYPEGHSWLE
jgi:hypothetical protein